MTEIRAIINKPSDDHRKRGLGSDGLEEPVPGFVARDDDEVISGKNNTWIVLGRDRTPATNSGKSVASVTDGYGGRQWQAAGAIDIVVGRGAPYPISEISKSPASKESPKIALDPIFGVATDSVLAAQELEGGFDHSGILMDAARIYISQKTDIDQAFNLVEGWSNASPKEFSSPRSAIGMKADEIRIVSRQGMKLVTGPIGGANGKDRVNSVGGDVSAIYGIDLIAGNGNLPEGQDQEPLVKGLALASALEEINSLISDLTGIVSTLFQIQFVFNVSTASHWHPEIVLLGFPGLPSPVLLGQALPFYITETMSKALPSMVNHKMNLGYFGLNYLTPTFDGYICSRYNSTN